MTSAGTKFTSLLNFLCIQPSLYGVIVAKQILLKYTDLSQLNHQASTNVCIVALSLYGGLSKRATHPKRKSAQHTFSACKSCVLNLRTYWHHMRQRVDISPPDQQGNALHSRKTTSSSPNPRADSPAKQTREGYM